MTRKYYIVEPEVAGGLGSNTVMDSSTHPPVVSKLHYQFDGWLGDQIVESFPVYLVTENLARRIVGLKLVGSEFAEAEMTVSPQFKELHPDRTLPKFVWLKVKGTAGRDDFGIAPDGRLVVSETALNLLRSTNPRALDVFEFDK